MFNVQLIFHLGREIQTQAGKWRSSPPFSIALTPSSVLEVNLNVMCYINSRSTYLLAYLLQHKPCCAQTEKQTQPRTHCTIVRVAYNLQHREPIKTDKTDLIRFLSN